MGNFVRSSLQPAASTVELADVVPKGFAYKSHPAQKERRLAQEMALSTEFALAQCSELATTRPQYQIVRKTPRGTEV